MSEGVNTIPEAEVSTLELEVVEGLIRARDSARKCQKYGHIGKLSHIRRSSNGRGDTSKRSSYTNGYTTIMGSYVFRPGGRSGYCRYHSLPTKKIRVWVITHTKIGVLGERAAVLQVVM